MYNYRSTPIHLWKQPNNTLFSNHRVASKDWLCSPRWDFASKSNGFVSHSDGDFRPLSMSSHEMTPTLKRNGVWTQSTNIVLSVLSCEWFASIWHEDVRSMGNANTCCLPSWSYSDGYALGVYWYERGVCLPRFSGRGVMGGVFRMVGGFYGVLITLALVICGLARFQFSFYH